MKEKLLNVQPKDAADLSAKSNEIVVEQVISTQSDKKKNDAVESTSDQALEKEPNGPKGLEPTRYGDWESKGRCYDF